ncbi:MAG: DUF421 domain-containing protein [Proteobacteria bacterium]|nr:MAG: DUF421 domain-containing protein [Pseudomonadota bacterium]
MWELSHPWWEFVVRAAIIYVVVVVLLRISGKKQIGELAPIDLVLLLILSETVQNAMNAGDDSVTAGIILATTLVTLSSVTDRLAFRFKKFETLIEGEPVVLVHNGKVNQKNMNKDCIFWLLQNQFLSIRKQEKTILHLSKIVYLLKLQQELPKKLELL